MRKYLPLIRFAFPWFTIGALAGAVIVWLIVAGDVGKVGAVSLTTGYIIAAIIVAWFVAPLAPPKVKP